MPDRKRSLPVEHSLYTLVKNRADKLVEKANLEEPDDYRQSVIDYNNAQIAYKLANKIRLANNTDKE